MLVGQGQHEDARWLKGGLSPGQDYQPMSKIHTLAGWSLDGPDCGHFSVGGSLQQRQRKDRKSSGKGKWTGMKPEEVFWSDEVEQRYFPKSPDLICSLALFILPSACSLGFSCFCLSSSGAQEMGCHREDSIWLWQAAASRSYFSSRVSWQLLLQRSASVPDQVCAAETRFKDRFKSSVLGLTKTLLLWLGTQWLGFLDLK